MPIESSPRVIVSHNYGSMQKLLDDSQMESAIHTFNEDGNFLVGPNSQSVIKFVYELGMAKENENIITLVLRDDLDTTFEETFLTSTYNEGALSLKRFLEKRDKPTGFDIYKHHVGQQSNRDHLFYFMFGEKNDYTKWHGPFAARLLKATAELQPDKFT